MKIKWALYSRNKLLYGEKKSNESILNMRLASPFSNDHIALQMPMHSLQRYLYPHGNMVCLLRESKNPLHSPSLADSHVVQSLQICHPQHPLSLSFQHRLCLSGASLRSRTRFQSKMCHH